MAATIIPTAHRAAELDREAAELYAAIPEGTGWEERCARVLQHADDTLTPGGRGALHALEELCYALTLNTRGMSAEEHDAWRGTIGGGAILDGMMRAHALADTMGVPSTHRAAAIWQGTERAADAWRAAQH